MLVMLCCSLSGNAQSAPEEGTYFIVNVATTSTALVLVGGGINSNIRIRAFNKRGRQKWKIKQHITKGKNGNKIISYTIQNASSCFYLRPNFVPDNHEAILSDNDANSSFAIVSDKVTFIVISVKMGGDVLY